MKRNGTCWTRALAVPLLATMLLSGCGAVAGSTCVPVVEYTPEFQSRAADQLATLPEGSPVVVMILDYLGMREQARACNG